MSSNRIISKDYALEKKGKNKQIPKLPYPHDQAHPIFKILKYKW
jgi:hypothetical protein